RLALGGEIGRGSLTRLRCHRRAPMPEKFAHPRFVYRIARRWWVGYPIIELKTAVAAGPHIARPDLDLLGLPQQHAASADPAPPTVTPPGRPHHPPHNPRPRRI